MHLNMFRGIFDLVYLQIGTILGNEINHLPLIHAEVFTTVSPNNNLPSPQTNGIFRINLEVHI